MPYPSEWGDISFSMQKMADQLMDFPVSNDLEVPEILVHYASCGLKYKAISAMMETYHDVTLSENAVRKRLKRYGYPSRRGMTDVTEQQMEFAIKEKLTCLPRTVGYRHITDLLKQDGLNIRRYSVMKCMQRIDPEGVEFRRRRRLYRRSYISMGPNHTWHIDGYDKLKPYGFPIHGCIDGYSRKVIWLKVGPSNNDPKQIAYHYMNAVSSVGGCPLTVQADKGTENTIVGALQLEFRETRTNRMCFQHISSQLNQRIEAWWSMLRRKSVQWWIDFFKDLVDSGIHSTDDLIATRCLRYAFMPLLQKELDSVVEVWNNHYISSYRNGGCPNGQPNLLFSLPSLTGGQDCIQPIDEDSIRFGYTQTLRPSITGDEITDKLAEDMAKDLGWNSANSWKESLEQYIVLYDFLKNRLS